MSVLDSSRAGVQRAVPALVVLFVLGALVLRLVGACWGVPVPSGDQVLFLPVAYEWRAHGHFQHPFFMGPGGASHAYNWHGWLYPLVVAAFPTSRHVQTLLVGATALGLLAVAVFALYGRIARLERERCALLVLLIGAIVSYQIGRPESLLTLLWGVALVCERTLPARRFDAAAALLLGLAIVTQPVLSSAAFAVFALHAACVRTSVRQFASSLAGVGAGALFVALGLTCLCSPLALLDWLQGLQANAAYVASRTDGGLGDFVRYLILQPTLPLALVYLVLALLLAPELWRLQREPRLRSPALVAAVTLAAFIALTAVRIPATVYNLVALGPPIAASTLAAARGPALRVALGVAGAAAAASLGVAVFSVLAASTGTSLAELQAELRGLRPCAIAADPSSWLAVEEAVGREHLCAADDVCPTRVILQANSGLLAPPARVGRLGLELDRFHHTPPAVLGLGMETTRKDYAHAVYGEPSRCSAALAAQ